MMRPHEVSVRAKSTAAAICIGVLLSLCSSCSGTRSQTVAEWNASTRVQKSLAGLIRDRQTTFEIQPILAVAERFSNSTPIEVLRTYFSEQDAGKLIGHPDRFARQSVQFLHAVNGYRLLPYQHDLLPQITNHFFAAAFPSLPQSVKESIRNDSRVEGHFRGDRILVPINEGLRSSTQVGQAVSDAMYLDVVEGNREDDPSGKALLLKFNDYLEREFKRPSCDLFPARSPCTK